MDKSQIFICQHKLYCLSIRKLRGGCEIVFRVMNTFSYMLQVRECFGKNLTMVSKILLVICLIATGICLMGGFNEGRPITVSKCFNLDSV